MSTLQLTLLRHHLNHNTLSNYTSSSSSNSTISLAQMRSQSQNQSQPSSLQKAMAVIIIFSIIFIIIIVYIIYSCCKKSKTIKQYNQTPQNFTQVPKHTSKQLHVLNQKKLILILNQQDQNNSKPKYMTTIQQKNVYNSRFYEVKFRNPKFSTIIFQNELLTDCYFQIEIIQLNSQIQLGYVNVDHLQKLKKTGTQDLGRIGISINNYGATQLYGENLFSYKWNIGYGDTIGIGITTVNQVKRVWITKNGELMNPPTLEERQAWIASQQITAQMKQNFKNQKTSQTKKKSIDAQNLGYDREKYQQQGKMKKIVLQSMKQFQYYAVITSSVLKKQKPSIINVNVGGNVFKMRQQSLSMGLLGKNRDMKCLCFPC